MEKIFITFEKKKAYVMARDMYARLSIGRDFPTWVLDKIRRGKLIEGIHYTTIMFQGASGKPSMDYKVDIHSAIHMLEISRANLYTTALLEMLNEGVKKLDIMNASKKPRRVKCKDDNVIEFKQLSVDDIEDGIIIEAPGEDITFGNVIRKESDIFGGVNFISIDGKEYAFAKDVAEALGYKNISRDIQRHCLNTIKSPYDVLRYQNGTFVKTRGHKLLLIDQGDIYRLIIKSKLPAAMAFERWVFDEVLPSIRTHGMYATTKTVDDFLNDPDYAISMLKKYKDERQEKERLLRLQEENKPKLIAYEDFLNSDGLFSFANASKIMNIPRTVNSKSIVGRNTLLSWLRADGILGRSKHNKNMPYQTYVNRGYFKVKAMDEETGKAKITVKLTTTGLDWIYNKYKYSNMPDTLDFSNSYDEHHDIAM